MVLLPTSRFLQVYNAIKADKHNSEERGIIVFVANGDVDSLCSMASLESIFSREDMTMSFIPVENYDDVQQHSRLQNLGETEDLKTVIMINCGATDDVRGMCDLSDNVRLIIVDSHRPIWHGYNTEDQNNIVLVADDDPVPIDEVPKYIQEHEELDQELEEDSEESEVSEEAEAGSERGVTEHGEASGSGAGLPEHRGGARKRRAERAAERLRDYEKYHDDLDEYYEFKAGYGKPTALLLFELASSRQEEDNFHIWLAILGLTDQYLTQRVDPQKYSEWRQELQNYVVQHNMEEEPDEDYEQYGNNRAKHRPTVVRVDGLRLAFLTRWTLSSSMLYNHHVATRFQTWREAGKKQVHFLLSKMNIRMDERQARYTSMHPAVDPHFREKLPETVATFGLNWEQLKYDGFELHYKNDFKMPAMDHVMAITAMLGRTRTLERSPQDIFWEAEKCLYPHTKEGMQLLTKGIERAKEMAVQIVEQGGLALTRKQVQGQRGFWYLDLANISFTGQHEFHHHSSLLKLAIFLRDANAQRIKSTAGLMVVGPPNQNDDCYIVVVRDKHQAGVSLQSNYFARPLKEALNDCGASVDYKQATFDPAVFVIKKHLVTAFCEEMRAVISEIQRRSMTVANA